MGVDIIAGAKDEEAGAAGGGASVPFRHIVHDGGDAGLTHGGQAVCEEDDVAGAARGEVHLQRGLEGGVDVGAAAGGDVPHEVPGLADSIWRGCEEAFAEAVDSDGVAEGDDAEAVL